MAIAESNAASGRIRGRKAGIDLDQIIAAARSLDPDELTMQAVADELGVDRKAVNHHVNDRETLLDLVARDAFLTRFASVHVHPDASWQEACRTYAAGLSDSVIAAGPHAGRVRLDSSPASTYLLPSEAVAEKFVAAGFDDEAAIRSLALLTNICMAYARDIVFAARSRERHRRQSLKVALAGSDLAQFENLARIAQSTVDTYDAEQLVFGVENFIRGIEGLLKISNRAAAPDRAD